MGLRDLLGRGARRPGWLAVSIQPGSLSFAHAIAGPGGKSAVTRCGTRNLDKAVNNADRVAKELALDRYQCAALLPSSDYQVMLVDAPNVPQAELKTAVRWKLKDMLDYRLDEATVDMLDIPPDATGGSRGHWVYAVAARNEIIRQCIQRFDDARIPLAVIDIVETAQRNVAALFETPERGLAFLYVAEGYALLTINYRRELYLARRIDVGMESFMGDDEAAREDALSRIGLELHRSFDHFDRQFPFVGVAKLLLGPEPKETGLAAYLSQNLDFPVEHARLSDVLTFGADATVDQEAAWRLFPVVGAALRDSAKSP